MAMTLFKVIATICWKFECDKDADCALKNAKRQIDQIIQSHPQGDLFDGFSIQVDVVKMKDRKKLVHIGEFSIDDVFPYVTLEESKRDYIVDGGVYSIKMNSDRYHVFKSNPACVSCGLIGTRIFLDINPGDHSPHFNLYGEEDGRLVLMTKDHIVAKSKGGLDELSNFQTMCHSCNNLKGNYDLNNEQVRKLRQILSNSERLTRKELRDKINSIREEMSIVDK